MAEIGPFVRQLADEDGIDWAAVSAADVTRFVTDACSRPPGRAPSSSLLAALRSFLRFAQLEGWIDLPLAQAVPSVARRAALRCPAGPNRARCGGSWMAVDRDSAAGRRDYCRRTRCGIATHLTEDGIDRRFLTGAG